MNIPAPFSENQMRFFWNCFDHWFNVAEGGKRGAAAHVVAAADEQNAPEGGFVGILRSLRECRADGGKIGGFRTHGHRRSPLSCIDYSKKT